MDMKGEGIKFQLLKQNLDSRAGAVSRSYLHPAEYLVDGTVPTSRIFSSAAADSAAAADDEKNKRSNILMKFRPRHMEISW